MQYWLLKSEPETYSFSDLIRDRKTNWDQVRNYQARNFIRNMSPLDQAVIYHSGEERAAVGIAQITSSPYVDPDPEGGEWVQVDIKPLKPFVRPVTLATIKSEPNLKDLLLIRQSRLSVMPITASQFKTLCKMGGVD